MREAGRGLRDAGSSVELRVTRLDTRSLESADVVVVNSAAGMAPLATQLAPERASFACEDEVVLIGPTGAAEAQLGEALSRADAIVLADPRGPGEQAEAALGWTGQRAAVAKKLRYVATPAQVLDAVRSITGSVGLLLRSDLPPVSPSSTPSYSVVAIRFDGGRQCPTAAALTRTKHPALARALVAALKETPPNFGTRKD